jgi:acyl-CoA synthetase (AMP-forming)/AMP-acid ligase II
MPALEGHGSTLTYRGLADRAGRIEEAARSAGLNPDEPVLVPVANETGDLAALIGVWLAGGVAVPVARQAPERAIATLRAATGARFSLTNAADAIIATTSDEAPPHRPLLAGAALVVFTSGSTGRPKGVVLSHRAFAGKLEAIDGVLGFTAHTRALLVLQITFVIGLWVSLLTLLRG